MAGAGPAKYTGFDFTECAENIFPVSKDLCEQQIKAVPDQLLNERRCSSDRLVLVASSNFNGYRVSRMKQEDEHVFNVLRNTSQCENSVGNNGRKSRQLRIS
jgi:hypothetical protein